MTTIKLLKEARGASVRVLDGLNARIDRASKQGESIPVYNGIVELHDIIGKIDAALAAPEPDAMEIVEKIRDYYIYHPEAYDDYAVANFTLPEDEAVALIEDYGRRVPREMLTEIFNNAVNWALLGDPEQVDEIAAKYGVKVEG